MLMKRRSGIIIGFTVTEMRCLFTDCQLQVVRCQLRQNEAGDLVADRSNKPESAFMGREIKDIFITKARKTDRDSLFLTLSHE